MRERNVVIESPRSASAPVRFAIPSSVDAPEHTVAEALRTVYQSRGFIIVVALAIFGAGLLYFFAATPIYRSDVVLQVEEPTKTIPGLGELSPLLADKIPADTEMELIKSRSLLGSVVQQLGLEVNATPVRFPLLGALARWWRHDAPAEPFLGLWSYAWGGERIRVERLEVPRDLVGQRLMLVALTGDRYELRGPDGRPMLSGAVGAPAAAGSGAGRAEIYVSELVARPGTRFRVVRRSREAVVESLKQDIKVGEKGKKTGVLLVTLEDSNPARAAAILNTLANTYVRQNVEHKSAEAGKTLAFLETQLPTLKANLESAEAARKTYQVRKGTLDLSREAGAMLERSVALEKAISAAELERSELRQRFTGDHPTLLAVSSKLEKLRQERDAINAQMRELPSTEVESTRLTRDVRVASELYDVLLNKAQELRVVKSGTIGNVRVVDVAEPGDKPVRPNAILVLAFSLLLGVTAGVGGAFLRRSMNTGVDDPEEIERSTGISVYATIPRSVRESGLSRRRRGALPILAEIHPDDSAVEGVRSLRTAIQFALAEGSNNVIVVTGPTAGVGKSFVAVNLAHVMAASGRNVVVVDGDLRRGRLHRFFDGERHPGLSDVLNGTAVLADAIRTSNLAGLHWLPTGHIPPNPSELLSSQRFERVLGELSDRHDVVIFDTAPILPVTDAAVIGRSAASTILVLAAGVHPMHEIVSAMKRLAHNGVRVQGAVMNDLSGTGSRYSRYRYDYRYGSRA